MKNLKLIKADSHHFVGSVGTEMADTLRTLADNGLEDEQAAVGASASAGKYDIEIRDCLISWNATPELMNHIEKIIKIGNKSIWKEDLKYQFNDPIQVTKYIGKGHHYAWHRDSEENSLCVNNDRVLSISLCVSHKENYEGGEFEFRRPNTREVMTYKLGYGEFIVFPSTIIHRVRPMVSGERISLVAWYL